MSPYNDNIKSEQNGQEKTILTEEQLMAYMEGKLSAAEVRQVEEMMSEESAESDAIEGLKMMHPAEIKRTVADLQRKLHSELLRNSPKRKSQIKDDYWSWIAVVVILLLIVIGYVVVRIASK